MSSTSSESSPEKKLDGNESETVVGEGAGAAESWEVGLEQEAVPTILRELLDALWADLELNSRWRFHKSVMVRDEQGYGCEREDAAMELNSFEWWPGAGLTGVVTCSKCGYAVAVLVDWQAYGDQKESSRG